MALTDVGPCGTPVPIATTDVGRYVAFNVRAMLESDGLSVKLEPWCTPNTLGYCNADYNLQAGQRGGAHPPRLEVWVTTTATWTPTPTRTHTPTWTPTATRTQTPTATVTLLAYANHHADGNSLRNINANCNGHADANAAPRRRQRPPQRTTPTRNGLRNTNANRNSHADGNIHTLSRPPPRPKHRHP